MGGLGHQWGAASSTDYHSVPAVNWLLGSKDPAPLSNMEHRQLLGSLGYDMALKGDGKGQE